ncbi:hypothetical protein M5_0080 [Lysinibacillus phage vB_LfM_LysYB2]|nr:hypothetical protein M5_0080 [Lysinibacillus phage vB_LfM_LysYB2]
MSIKNELLKDGKLVTAYGVIEFDSEGVLKTKLEQDAIEALSQLKGFEKVAIKETPKAPVKSVEKTVEVEEEVAEPEKKTAPAKTAKKATK